MASLSLATLAEERLPQPTACAQPTLLVATFGSAVAADNAALVNKVVRANVSGITAGTVSGKLISQDSCLYVQFDQKTKDGFVSVRLDQVTSLEVAGASLAAILKQEPKKCFEEANG
jgi:hypothetical protein